MSRVTSSLTAWMNNKRRLEQQEEPGLASGDSNDTRERKRKEEFKEQVVEKWDWKKSPLQEWAGPGRTDRSRRDWMAGRTQDMECGLDMDMS